MTDPLVRPDDSFLPAARALLAAVLVELEHSVGGPPGTSGLRPGALVAFDGDCAGDAWVRVVRFYPSDIFPQPSQVSHRCTPVIALELQAGIARCASVLDEDGRPPSPDTLEDEVEVQMSDAAALLRAVGCAFGPTYDDHLVGQYQPFGPDGGVAGGLISVIVALPNYCA